jgi:hypothetical protein
MMGREDAYWAITPCPLQTVQVRPQKKSTDSSPEPSHVGHHRHPATGLRPWPLQPLQVSEKELTPSVTSTHPRPWHAQKSQGFVLLSSVIVPTSANTLPSPQKISQEGLVMCTHINLYWRKCLFWKLYLKTDILVSIYERVT